MYCDDPLPTPICPRPHVTGPTTVTTTDKIRFLSVGQAFQGAEVKVEDPDSEGQGEVGVV